MRFSTLFERRGRQVIPTAANPLLGLLGGGKKSKTGIDIDEEEALSSTAVWSAVTQLSQGVASLPLHLYKWIAEDGKEKYKKHPLYNILHLQPNPEMTSFAFREAQMGQILLLGTTYAEIVRNNLNQIIELWPLMTGRMETLRNKSNGELFYRYQLPDGTNKIFLKDAILRINGFSHSGLLGYKPVEKTKEAIALNLAYEEYAARFFGDGARPPAVLEHPNTLGQEAQERLRTAFAKMHEGLSNSQRVAILEEGMKMHELGFSVRDSQVPELRRFQISEISRIFNIPPPFLHELDRATFSNVEELGRWLKEYSLRFWLVRFEQNYNTQLLNPKEQKKYFFEHSMEGIWRSDIKTRYEAYRVGVENGWLNANEIRRLENMNPQPGEQGKKYFVPLNWITKEDAGKPPELPPKEEFKPEDEEETKKFWNKQRETRSVQERDLIIRQYYPLFKQAAQRIINKEAIAIKKEIKKNQENRAKSDLEEWLDDFYSKQSDYIKQQIGPVFRAFAEAIQKAAAQEIGVDVGVDAELEVFISEFIDRYAERHIDSSHGQLVALLKEELDDIALRVDEWVEEDNRADKIAMNETVRCSNAIYQFAAFGAGLSVVWRTRGPTTCPYCMSLEGRRVSTGQSFANDSEEIKPKGIVPMRVRGIKKHPPLHRGCDCYLGV